MTKGTPGVPSDPRELAGKYFQTDYTTAIYLTLLSNGTYSAQWKADIGDCGEAVGNWSLNATQLVLSPSKETEMMRGYLRNLDIYRFKSNWVFVAEGDRTSYEKFGLDTTGAPLFHFIKDDVK